jgi:hypothetical protein
MEDIDGAVGEITNRLTSALAGSKPAVIAVKADPPEAQVLINRNYAGRGAVQARERPPGPVTVAVAAEGYAPELAQTELVGGEITEIDVTLNPLLYYNINIGVPGFNGVSLYQVAMYVGEAPYNLLIPIDTMAYVTAETKDRQAAKIVFPSPDTPDESLNYSLKLKPSPLPGQRRVNRVRTDYYRAWGATWLTAMLAWGANGIFTSRMDALPNSSSMEFYNDARTWYYVSTGSLILLGVVAAYDIFQLTRYLYTSTEGATPVARQEKK